MTIKVVAPCTLEFMAPVVGVVFELSSSNIIAAGAVLLSFGLGHYAGIIITGGLATRMQAYLDCTNRLLWSFERNGLLVVLGGVHTLWN